MDNKMWVVDVDNVDISSDLIFFAKSGDADAKELVLKKMYMYVVSIAQKFSSYSYTFEDFISFGNLGVLEAIERFDPRSGAKFSTYATYWINKELNTAVNTDTLISVPSYVAISKQKVKKKLKGKQDIADMSISELSKIVSEQEARAIKISLGNSVCSYDSFVGTDDDSTYLSSLSSSSDVEHDVMRIEQRKFVNKMLSSLEERSQVILRMRFGLITKPLQDDLDNKGIEDKEIYTLEDVGTFLGGVTRERARQLEVIAMNKLKALVLKETKNKAVSLF